MTTTQPPVPPPPPPTAEPTSASRDPLDTEPNGLFARRAESPKLHGRELALLISAAVLLDISLRGSLDNLAAVLATLVIAGALVVRGRIDRRVPRALVTVAVLLSPWLYLRSSSGLTVATVAAIAGLLALAAGLSREGDVFDLRAGGVIAHAGSQLFEWMYGIPMVKGLIAENGSRGAVAAGLRGVLFAVPIVAIFGILLASADEVFADVLSIGEGLSIVEHVILTAVAFVALLGLVSRAAHRTPSAEAGIPRLLSSIEVNLILGSVTALFAGFVATQVTVALGGVDHIFETDGLTRAEHARSGFFQLLWVAALTLALLGAVRSARQIDRDDQIDRFRSLATAIVAVTSIITAISIQRLLFYVEEFGLTPLRLWSLATAGWIGILLVAYAISVNGYRYRNSWFPAFVVLSAAAFVTGLNVANPDAVVARYNLAEMPAEELDVESLVLLSDDVVPVMVTAASDAEQPNAARIRNGLCRRSGEDQEYGILGRNAAVEKARELLDQVCANRSSNEFGD